MSKLPALSVMFDELAKIGAVSDAQAARSLERYEALERSKPTLGQMGRYAAIGAVATPLVGALGDAIAGKGFEAGKRLRGHLGRAVTGGLTASAIPIARTSLDRRAEMGTLKNYLHERGVDTAHRGAPTVGKLSAPFEPVEKAAGVVGRLARAASGHVDGRVKQQAQQAALQQVHGRLRHAKEKDSGMSGVTPSRPFDAGGYTVDLVKSAFATSAYSANIPYPTVPQKSFQPGFRAPSLQRAVQHQPQAIKTAVSSRWVRDAVLLSKAHPDRLEGFAHGALHRSQDLQGLQRKAMKHVRDVDGLLHPVADTPRSEHFRRLAGLHGEAWDAAEKKLKVAFKLQGEKNFQGLDIAIENRKGSVRKGVDKDGKPWRTVMKHPYGYIKNSKGADGEEVDCYIGPKKDATHAHVVHQHKADGTGYDEDKVMLGFEDADAARKAYLAHYNDPKFLGPMKSLPMEKIKALLASGKQLRKIAAGAPTRGNFMMASEVPAFRGPTLKSPIQPAQGPIVEKLGGVPTTPAGILASAKAVGAPRVTAPPGPSIAQVAKPVGFGKPKPGAVKNAL